MPVMSYDTWMRRTRRGLTKPRSSELRVVDAALKSFTERPDSQTLGALKLAVKNWTDSKDEPLRSIRNSDGAVADLLRQLGEEDKASAQHQTAKSSIQRMNRPAGLLGEIAGGAGKLAAGQLGADYSGMLLKLETDPNFDNVRYEGFAGEKLQKARLGYADAMLGAQKATMGMRAALMGVATGRGAGSPELERYTTWFGTASRAAMEDMLQKAETMLLAMKTRPVTFVLRETITNHYINGVDPLGPTVDDVVGPGVYGYVWNAGNHTGSGMRVVINQRFLTKPDRYEGPAATIYHELTHKVLGTTDKDSAGALVYGIPGCRALARTNPGDARQLADCWSYYAISFLKTI
ncbi:M35 family metallo-endopeptidase [Variovorax sp. MHTC-1]|uniref:M35 family metallo-endopeptidase n=1 Tax=Variovorax sp. MHTC-1 TaxID=2495593 RepID=UPI000F862ED4|nr:M35 family metallo-endopeptidase [Variovorax sp. MHTC-1]RST50645.1 hypothetical protein EJI01_21220 [Variovorax sp. MHTC-1]